MKFFSLRISRQNLLLLAIFYTFMFSFGFSRVQKLKNVKDSKKNLETGKQIDVKSLKKLIRDVSKNLNNIILKPNNAENKFETIISSKPNIVYRYKTRPSRKQKTNIKTLNTKVKCPLGTAINGFHIGELNYKSRDEFIDANFFEYNCYKHKLILDKFLNFKTEKFSLDEIDFKKSNVNKLLNLKIKCPEAFLLTKFRLAFTKEKQIYYRYQCAESDVDEEVCDYSDSNKVSIPAIAVKENQKSKKFNDKNDKKINSERKGETKNKDKKTKEPTTIIPFESLKKLYVDAPVGKFIKTLILKLDKENSEIYYRIKSCRIIDDEEDENDPDYELEEEEDDQIMKTPHEVLIKASIINTHNNTNPNVIIESEEKNEEFNKKYDRYELITIGNTENEPEQKENAKIQEEDEKK